ncbi:MAG: RagB/SusD family nutrient uptake outer membrane protein [Longimicrobiales bacterium]
MKIHRCCTSLLALAAVFALGACDLDLVDPNLPPEEQVISDPEGIRRLAIGLQAEWGNELVDPVYVVGLVTDEIGAGSATFDSYKNVDAGVEIDNNLDPSEGPWAAMYDVVQVANLLIDNAPDVPLETATRSGIIALARLFKAMAFGNLLQIFERIPLAPGPDNTQPEFASRAEAVQAVLTLLDEARAQIQQTPPSSDFDTQILAPGFDLANTIEAMDARFSLMFGDEARAMAAAQNVDPDVLSEFRFTATDPNPLWVLWYASGNAFQMRPEDRFRLDAEPGDERVDYWVTPADIAGAHGPLDHHTKYFIRDASFPAYLPDEMKLIRAEIHARQGNLAAAIALINEVRTQCSSVLDEPVACLPPYVPLLPTQQQVLDQILYEREYELYLQAVRWSDLRRFGEPVKYEFMMVPRSECDRNANAPTDICQLSTPPAS